MAAVDFSTWAVDPLSLTLGGRTYTVSPPSVEDAKFILAAAAVGEVHLKLVEGPVPPEIQEVADSIGDKHPALGPDVYDQMLQDGVHQVTADRMAYYAVFYWARGKAYADWLAAALWTPRDVTAEAGGAPRKGLRRRPTGRHTA